MSPSHPANRPLVGLSRIVILPIVRAALAEDIGPGDVTSQATVPAGAMARGCFLAKAAGIVAGLPVSALVFTELDESVKVEMLVAEGARVSPGQVLAEVHGPARALLSGERVALNFLQRLSGIATMASQAVDAVAGTRATILDTRKTTPGLRALEKYAVRAGGASNHRTGLYDMVLIKDNHIRLAGGIAAAVAAARSAAGPMQKIEVEVASRTELDEALAAGADLIMLDNMTLPQMAEAVAVTGGRAKLEASGNVTLANVAAVAATGVDFISMGALTHSYKSLDISLELELWIPAEGAGR